MALDASILSGVRPFEVPSQFEGYKNALALEGGMNQNAMARYSLAKAQREDAETEAFNKALRGADLSTPEGRAQAQRNALNASPQKGIAFGNQLLEQDSKRATLDKTRADTSKQIADQAARLIAGAKTDQDMDQAFTFWAQSNPQQAQVVRNQYMQARQSGAQVPDLAPKIASMFSEDVLKQIQAFAPKVKMMDDQRTITPWNENTLAGPLGPIAGAPVVNKLRTFGEEETGRHNPIMEGIARQNANTSRGQLDETRANNQRPVYDTERGGFASRPKPGNESKFTAVTGAPKGQKELISLREDTDNLRKEFEAKQTVKAYRDVLPIAAAAQTAPDTRSGDIQMAYSVGKILDPNSVVREGELKLVGDAATVMGKIEGELRTMTQGKGRLSPATRAELNAMLANAVAQRKASFDAEKKSYEGIVTRREYKPEDVFIETPPVVSAPTPKPNPQSDVSKLTDSEIKKRLGL